MSLYKRGRIWHYDFIYKKKRYQGSTDQANINKAKLVEAKVRSDTALEAFGIAPPKVAPAFKEFLEGAFLSHIRKHAKKPRTVRFYEVHVSRLLKHAKFAGLRLSQVDEEAISGYAPTGAIATINGDLRTLRRALRLAKKWRLMREVSVHTLPGEHQRTFVLSAELEARYLELAPYPLKQVAILMLDEGLRPEEVVCLRKADIVNAILTVREGKSDNAARALPLTERASVEIEFVKALWPKSEWLFPGRSGAHFNRKSLDNLHAKVRRDHNLPAEFVLYTLRHTFGTRLAESGASPFDIKQAMGHYSVTVTQRYVHPSADHLRVALKRKEAMDKTVRGEVHEDTSVNKLD